jgi:predicted glycosyltransferase
MNILILISHPAQFLFFKNTIINLKKKNHNIYILIKTKDILSDLLDELGWEYFNIQEKVRKQNKISIILSLLKRDAKILKFVFNNNVDIMLGTDASIAHVGKILNIPTVTTLEDDYDVIKHLAILTYPFTKVIFTPNVCDVGKWNHKKIGYNGYMKLAYLHPDYFVPDYSKVYSSIKEPYFLLRLSGLNAHHDFGIQGVSDNLLLEIINRLEKKGKVYISSEKKLKPEFEKYRLVISASDIHHFLSFSSIFICDSQSMAVEASILGIPNIRISSFKNRISVLEELENKYNLTFGFHPNENKNILNKIDELINDSDVKKRFSENRKEMLSEKIDVTKYLTEFIEDYPIKNKKIYK